MEGEEGRRSGRAAPPLFSEYLIQSHAIEFITCLDLNMVHSIHSVLPSVHPSKKIMAYNWDMGLRMAVEVNSGASFRFSSLMNSVLMLSDIFARACCSACIAIRALA